MEAVDLILRRRAKLDLKDKVDRNSKLTITVIIDNSFHCKDTDCVFCVQHGITAIHLAAWFGSLDIMKLLVQAGADQEVETKASDECTLKSSWASVFFSWQQTGSGL